MLTPYEANNGLGQTSPAQREANWRFVVRGWIVCAVIGAIGVAGLIYCS